MYGSVCVCVCVCVRACTALCVRVRACVCVCVSVRALLLCTYSSLACAGLHDVHVYLRWRVCFANGYFVSLNLVDVVSDGYVCVRVRLCERECVRVCACV